MKWKNEVTDLLRIDFPIIQAPMLGVTTIEMVAAISDLGGLGSLPVGGLSPEKTRELIRRTTAATNKSFAVNLFANDIPEQDMEAIKEMQQFIETMASTYKLTILNQPAAPFEFFSYKDQVEILLEEGVQIVSFTFGVPGDEIIGTFQRRNVVLIGTATCLKEAMILDEKGISLIVAQGIEAGGHRGTFLHDEPLPQVGAFSLISQLAGKVHRPIIAAGGIHNGGTIKAAMALGAKGVQPGTAFIASDESAAIPAYKKAVQEAADTDSVLTKAFTGRWARGLRNKFIMEFEKCEIKIPAYPIQHSITFPLRSAAQQQNNIEFTNLWAGQSSSMAQAKPAGEIFTELIAGAEALD